MTEVRPLVTVTECVTIKVTQAHIDAGVKDSHACPIALALRSQFDYPSVGRASWSALFNNEWEKMGYLPSEARAFIDRFDSGAPVSPRSFTLPLDYQADYSQ